MGYSLRGVIGFHIIAFLKYLKVVGLPAGLGTRNGDGTNSMIDLIVLLLSWGQGWRDGVYGFYVMDF